MDAFVAEIRLFAFNFAPQNWATCSGQLIAIQQNTALFSLIGTFYGGNGTTNFALPNFAGRMPMHQGQGSGLQQRQVGDQFGSEMASLDPSQLPAHNHAVMGGTQLPVASPGSFSGSPGKSAARPYVALGSPSGQGHLQTIQPAGGNQPHYNMPPYLVLNFCICLYGIFPPRS